MNKKQLAALREKVRQRDALPDYIYSAIYYWRMIRLWRSIPPNHLKQGMEYACKLNLINKEHLLTDLGWWYYYSRNASEGHIDDANNMMAILELQRHMNSLGMYSM